MAKLGSLASGAIVGSLVMGVLACSSEPATSGVTDASTDGGLDAARDGAPTDAAPPDVPPSPCTGAGAECGPDGYCDAKDCKSAGTCKPRPVLSDLVFDEVCGCDGITYWNREHAASLGQGSVSGFCGGPTDGPGGKAVLCDASKPCPGGGHCTSLFCGPDHEQSCWLVPEGAKCGPATLRGWATCDGAATCLSECEALLTGKPFGTSTICQ
jgi:hypothetical protein